MLGFQKFPCHLKIKLCQSSNHFYFVHSFQLCFCIIRGVRKIVLQNRNFAYYNFTGLSGHSSSFERSFLNNHFKNLGPKVPCNTLRPTNAAIFRALLSCLMFSNSFNSSIKALSSALSLTAITSSLSSSRRVGVNGF